MKRIVSKNHSKGDRRTQYLSLRPFFHKNSPTRALQSNIHGTAAIAKPLINENNATREKDGMMIMKPGRLLI